MTSQTKQAQWPASFTQLGNQAESIDFASELAQAKSRIDGVKGRAQYQRLALSEAAAALSGLRDELAQLQNFGQALAVSPLTEKRQNWQLSTKQAVERLKLKLTDKQDSNLFTNANAGVFLLSASSINGLVKKLKPVNQLLALPDLLAVERGLISLHDLPKAKMKQPIACVEPKAKTASNINFALLDNSSDLLKQQISLIESVSRDSNSPSERLLELADKKATKIEAIKAELASLQSLTGEIDVLFASGKLRDIANQISQPEVNHAYSVAFVVLSPTPLKFLEELF
ncbi:MAG: hypothetical protein ACPGUD_06345 [Parashewanella sp.]